MLKKSRETIFFKRKRQGKTNYRKRLKLLVAHKTRLVIRKSLKNILLQLIEYAPEGDRTLVSANSSELGKYGWNWNTSNIPASYLTGILLSKKAKGKKIESAIADIGFYRLTKGSRINAALKGVIDGGLKLPVNEKIFSDDSRLKGEHIFSYATLLKERGKYDKKFSVYSKKGIDIKDIVKDFEEVKRKIMEKND